MYFTSTYVLTQVGTPRSYGLKDYGLQNGGCCLKMALKKHPVNPYTVVVVNFCV